MTNNKPKRAPCGCSWRSDQIIRLFRVLWPTCFVECKCIKCRRTWTERYEFEGSVPIDGTTWEESAAASGEA